MITINFKDLAEVKTFAKELLGAEAPAQVVPCQPAPFGEILSDNRLVEMQPTIPAAVHPARAAHTHTVVSDPVPVETPVMPAAPIAVKTPAEPVSLVPTTAVTYTLNDLARAAMTLMDAGKQGDLQQLISGYGVVSLPELPKEQYGSFATALRGMGAQI